MAISTAVDISAVARTVGIKTQFINTQVGGVFFLPQRVALVGQGASAATYDTTKRQITSAGEAGQLYGFGSPIHLSALQLLPVNGDGVGSIPVTVYPLEDDGTATPSAGDITPTGTATKAGQATISFNGIDTAPFGIAVGDDPAAIITKALTAVNGTLEAPMIAADGTTKVDFTSKWAGGSANALTIAIDVPSDLGVTFAITQPVGGTVNPDVDDALNQVGDVWETMFLNCMEYTDTTTLDKYDVFGEGRWGALTHKPCVVFTGQTESDTNTLQTAGNLRKLDRTNALLSNPDSVNLPFVVAAGQLARIVKVANNNPPQDYARQIARYTEAGPDSSQWNYAQRDLLVKAGISTIEVRDGGVNVSDTVTFYHPDGETVPPYRYVCDIVKLMNIIYNVALIFNTTEWDGAPLIPDDQPTVNPTAKKPKNAKSVLSALATSLGENAIISDVPYTQDNIQAEISSQNPKRLDIVFPTKLSGNTNIISIDNNFGFFFGTPTVIN